MHTINIDYTVQSLPDSISAVQPTYPIAYFFNHVIYLCDILMMLTMTEGCAPVYHFQFQTNAMAAKTKLDTINFWLLYPPLLTKQPPAK